MIIIPSYITSQPATSRGADPVEAECGSFLNADTRLRPHPALRAEVDGLDGSKTTRGAVIVNMVLCGCAAYRTQLFLYLKACGREELGTMNLWAGVDAPSAG